MKFINSTLLATSLFTLSLTTQAIEVKTEATALTMCKAEAAIAHPDQTKIAHKKIKQLRGKFKINLKITTPEGKQNTVCEITNDGEITYSKK